MLQIIYLAMIQGGNALIPLILFPYLLSKIGAQLFANLATLEALSFIVITISFYSFDITGLKEIQKSKQLGENLISKTYYSILYARLSLFILCTIPYLLLIYIYNKNLLCASLVWLLFPLGSILQSSYLYQATSHNLPLALFVIVPRLMSCVLAFFLIDFHTNLIIASAFISLSYLASGLASVLFLCVSHGFRTPRHLIKEIIFLLQSGRHIYIGGLCVILYRGSNTLLLSFLGAPSIAVSLYAISEKYIKMLQALVFPITQAYAVRLTYILTQKGKSVGACIWNNVRQQLAIGVFLSVAFVFGIYYIAPALPIKVPAGLPRLMLLMIPAVAFGIINYMVGTIAYAALGHGIAYARIVWICGLTSVLIASILIHFFQASGAAFTYTFAEVLLATIFISRLKRGT